MTPLCRAANPLLKVTDIDRTAMVVTLSEAPNGSIGQAPLKHPLLRRWDTNAANIVEATSADDAWLDLEDGIQIQFQHGAKYRSGDYWLIPARVATGNIEWPQQTNRGQVGLDENINTARGATAARHRAPLRALGRYWGGHRWKCLVSNRP